ncbi:MAG: DUF2244 domain-containing protein [Burkholderiaceae bacterium]|nr:MAG: DUF2244 domain-containing protein [Burkholderiaceae bacterium]
MHPGRVNDLEQGRLQFLTKIWTSPCAAVRPRPQGRGPRHGGWRQGTGLTFRFATVSGQRIDWRSVRSSPGSLAQLGCAYLAFCMFSLAVASALWLRGVHVAMSVAGFCVAAAGWALVVFGRHMKDAETISLQGASLVVERETAGRKVRSEFDRSRVHVEPKACDRSLIMVSAQGRSVEVGRYVRPELRQALASEIRMALRTA